MDSIIFDTEDGQQIEFVVLDETRFNEQTYILVTEDADAEEVEVMILKSVGSDEEDVESFESVEDEAELKAVSDIFAQQLAEDDIELEI